MTENPVASTIFYRDRLLAWVIPRLPAAQTTATKLGIQNPVYYASMSVIPDALAKDLDQIEQRFSLYPRERADVLAELLVYPTLWGPINIQLVADDPIPGTFVVVIQGLRCGRSVLLLGERT